MVFLWILVRRRSREAVVVVRGEALFDELLVPREPNRDRLLEEVLVLPEDPLRLVLTRLVGVQAVALSLSPFRRNPEFGQRIQGFNLPLLRPRLQDRLNPVMRLIPS